MSFERIREFLDDLWFDLRERRLLPAVVALGVAIVAVPFMLGGSEEIVPPAASPAPDVAETRPAVAQAVESGIRTGGARLGGEAKNPFRQQLQSTPDSGKIDDAAAGAEAAVQAQTSAAQQLADQLTGASSAGSGGSGAPAGADVPAGDGSVTGVVEPPAATKTKTQTKTITKKIVKLERRSIRVRFGKLGKRHPVKGIESLDVLPREGAPVLVLLGVDGEGERAMFDVASNVKAVWGKGKCAPDPDHCDYLTLKPGEGVKLRYQPSDETAEPIVYSLTLVRISTKRVNA